MYKSNTTFERATATRNLCMRDFLKLHHNWDAYMGVQKERKSTFLTAFEHPEKEKGEKMYVKIIHET